MAQRSGSTSLHFPAQRGVAAYGCVVMGRRRAGRLAHPCHYALADQRPACRPARGTTLRESGSRRPVWPSRVGTDDRRWAGRACEHRPFPHHDSSGAYVSPTRCGRFSTWRRTLTWSSSWSWATAWCDRRAPRLTIWSGRPPSPAATDDWPGGLRRWFGSGWTRLRRPVCACCWYWRVYLSRRSTLSSVTRVATCAGAWTWDIARRELGWSTTGATMPRTSISGRATSPVARSSTVRAGGWSSSSRRVCGAIRRPRSIESSAACVNGAVEHR